VHLGSDVYLQRSPGQLPEFFKAPPCIACPGRHNEEIDSLVCNVWQRREMLAEIGTDKWCGHGQVTGGAE
jgi:hypothetical protein